MEFPAPDLVHAQTECDGVKHVSGLPRYIGHLCYRTAKYTHSDTFKNMTQQLPINLQSSVRLF